MSHTTGLLPVEIAKYLYDHTMGTLMLKVATKLDTATHKHLIIHVPICNQIIFNTRLGCREGKGKVSVVITKIYLLSCDSINGPISKTPTPIFDSAHAHFALYTWAPGVIASYTWLNVDRLV